MCIIVYKPRGVDFPSLETFRKCYENNSDGAGFAYPSGFVNMEDENIHLSTNGKVSIHKGLMTWADFETEFTKTFYDNENGKWHTELPVVFHFRIRTHGKSDAGATQPIAVTTKINSLRATRIETSVAVAHNGIISGCCDTKSKLSDSQIFARDYLSVLKLYQDITIHKSNCIKKMIGPSNKMVIMNGLGQVAIIGDFRQDNGCYYSNTSYMYEYVTVPVGRCAYDYYNYKYNYGKQYKRNKTDNANSELDDWTGLYDYYDL